MLLFTAVEANLALSGFINRKALENVWRQVDMDSNGTLDFGEFLCLMFLWTAIGSYKTIFTLGDNARIVSDAFADIQDLFKSYDKSGKLVLQQSEVELLISTHLAPLSMYMSWEDEDSNAEGSLSRGVTCPKLLHVLYAACAQYPGNNIPGKYQQLNALALPNYEPSSKRVGPRSAMWLQLREAFLVLESDFARLDCDENGVIDYAELTNGVQALVGEERLRILARLEYKFNKVDLDHSRSVDFYEYLHLSLLMIQDGSYSDLRQDTSNRSVIKRTLLDVHRYFVKYSKNSSFRLGPREIQRFASEVFGMVPSNLDEAFSKAAGAQKSPVSPGKESDCTRKKPANRCCLAAAKPHMQVLAPSSKVSQCR
jgi:Ca2+-binding EF-hand superfamily protein